MTDWKERLTNTLEPVLLESDPRPHISAYHNMPCAIFQYPPEAEFCLRKELTQLMTRLGHQGKEVVRISLAECLEEAISLEGEDIAELAAGEKTIGLGPSVDTLFHILSEYQPLDEIVTSKVPRETDPHKHILFLVRAGALFPIYRISSLLQQLHGKLDIPTILFYPGYVDGVAGLKFMGVLQADHSYRPKIF